MLSIDINQVKKIIKMPIWNNFYIMKQNLLPSGKTELTIMTNLNKNEEDCLDKIGKVGLTRGTAKFFININQTLCYGEINFNTGSNDYEQLKDFDLCDIRDMHGQDIWSDYVYASHTCHTPINRVRWTETWDSAMYAQQCHGKLNKPERTIIFKICC